MPKATTDQIIAYKTSLDKIYKRNLELNIGMTKKQIERDIKYNAQFPYESTKHKDVTTEDMINLTIHCDLYSDQFGLDNNFPPDEQDDQINLNIE